MIPGKYDLALYRGDTFRRSFTLWSDTERTVPLDLAGATAAAEIRDKSGGASIAVMGCVIEQPNIVHVSLDESAWLQPVPSGVWDLEITFPSGDVATPVAGKVAITGDVTNSTRVAAPKRPPDCASRSSGWSSWSARPRRRSSRPSRARRYTST